MVSLKISLGSCLAVVLFVLEADQVFGGATEEQMWAAGKLMRDVCQPRFPKITNEIGDQIKVGNVPDDKDARCYINCVMEMMQSMKKGKFLYDSTMKQVDILLPDNYKDEYRAGVEKCKTSATGIKNHCDASYAVFKCLRAEISRFAFP